MAEKQCAAKAKRVLVYRLGSLGDTVVALPALYLVARAFPAAERRLLTSFPPHTKAPPSSAILDSTGLIHGYFRYSYGTRSIRELAILWWKIARWRPHVLVYLSGPRGVASAKRDALFFRICGIKTLVGIPDTEEMQAYRSVSVAGAPPQLEAEASRLARNISPLGDADLENPSNWDLRLTLDEQASATSVLSEISGLPLIAVSVGTKMQAKDWGADNWKLLLHRLALLYPDHALVLTGAQEESAVSESAAEGWRRHSKYPALNLCGALTPRQSAAVFARSGLFIGHDSGPMHLAAAIQIPCVAIFSARNIPRVWFPYGNRHRVIYHNVDCAGCGLETCVAQKKKCILSIGVDEVIAEIATLLPVPGSALLVQSI